MKIYSVGVDKTDDYGFVPDKTIWMVYWYSQGDWEGSGSAYAKDSDGNYWFLNLGHCSCYGAFDSSEKHWEKLQSKKELIEIYLAGDSEESVNIKLKIQEIDI